MKNRKRRRSDTVRHLKFKKRLKCTSYNLSETSIQVLLKYQLVEKRNSCAHLGKCSAVWGRAKEEIKDGFFYAELNASRTI